MLIALLASSAWKRFVEFQLGQNTRNPATMKTATRIAVSHAMVGYLLVTAGAGALVPEFFST